MNTSIPKSISEPITPATHKAITEEVLDPIIRPKELAAKLGVTVETLRLWRKGRKAKNGESADFPQPVILGTRAIGWRCSDINTWIIKRISKQNGAANEGYFNSVVND